VKKSKKLPPIFRFEIWCSLERAVVGFCYPPEGRKPFDYDDDPDDYIQVAPLCWAHVRTKPKKDKIHPYQFDTQQAAAFISKHIPGSYVERVQLAGESA
jgi:hypothetical protein